MRLIELEPAWLSEDVFIFRSPTGNKDLLTCKRIRMSRKDQYRLIYNDNIKYLGLPVVMTDPEVAWRFIRNDFNTLTVSPSIDASASGNWHGFIKNGMIVGGIPT